MLPAMDTGRHIRAIGTAETEQEIDPATGAAASEDAATTATIEADWDDAPGQHTPRRWGYVAFGVIAIVFVAGWTAFFAWAHRTVSVSTVAPAELAGLIAQWATPVLLVAVAWLIAMRSSTRETARFGDAARTLANESALLENRLATVNRELSLAREFLAAQSRDLDYLGRSAVERISEHAAHLQALVTDNGTQVEAIAGVSATALENMAQLRDNLPVIANSARDVSNQIGGAGRSAQAQLGELISGFERLNEFGQASERQVVSLRQRIDTALEELTAFVESMDANNEARIAALRGESESLDGELQVREAAALEAMRHRGEALNVEMVAAHDARQLEEAAALAAMRGRIASFTREAHEAAATVRAGERAALEAWENQVLALRERLESAVVAVGELDEQFLDRAREKLALLTAEAEAIDERLVERDREFQERVARRQAEFENVEAAVLTGLMERSSALDDALSARHAAQEAHAGAIAERGEAMAARLGEIEARIAAIAERSVEADRTLTTGSERLAQTIGTSAQQLHDSEAALARLTDASVRLLELIQGAAAHSRNELPAAIGGFEGQLETAREASSEIRAALDEARRLGDELSKSLGALRGVGENAIGDLDALRSRLSGTAQEQTAALQILRDQLAATGEDNRTLAAGIAGELSGAIDRLKGTSTTLLADLEAGQKERIAALADRIGHDSAQAIDRVIGVHTEQSIARLDEATARSTEVAQEAVANLREQLARVHELTGNLESRAARAREQVEEQVDSDFARRMALITESLNSHSIDIAKALSTEVTDTAWASYLKGDRGVFTRRAVKLIDGGEAREIASLYEDDHEFRDHVSRYIHDFEAMLRTMLSTRDGHALGVTLLSSDMGKLYVALAQAIQRLRQ